MGLVQAVTGAVGGMFADQWKDFYTVPAGLPSTAALFAAVPQGTNAGRGSNTSGSSNIITNGSKIIVPEGYGLLLFQDGKITGFVAEPGGYEWRSDDLNSKSIFAGDGIVSPLITQSWERFKFGGQPGSQQAAFFVSLKELPDNRFGTQSEIYWDDGFLNTQVGAVTRGSYTLKIVDPILFVKNFVPASYLRPGAVFDFTDLDNAALGGEHLVAIGRGGLVAGEVDGDGADIAIDAQALEESVSHEQVAVGAGVDAAGMQRQSRRTHLCSHGMHLAQLAILLFPCLAVPHKSATETSPIALFSHVSR